MTSNAKQANHLTKEIEKRLTFGYLFFLILFPVWLYNTATKGLTSDMTILQIFAERFLAGDKMSESWYDSNPPLSILFYVPAVWMANIFPFANPYMMGTVYYPLFLTVLLTPLAWMLIRKNYEDTTFQKTLFLAVLFSFFYVPGYDFGQRDHFIFIGLFLSFLAQRLYQHAKPLFGGIGDFVFFAVVAIPFMLKPFYLVIPAAMILYRAWSHKSFATLFRMDSLGFTFSVMIYALSLLTVFSDYLTIILPDVREQYGSAPKGDSKALLLAVVFSIGLLILSFYTLKASKHVKSYLPYYYLGPSCFVIYLLFTHGFPYHKLPFFCFLTILGICGLIEFFSFGRSKIFVTIGLSSLIIFLLLYGAFAVYKTPNFDTALNKLVGRLCENTECPIQHFGTFSDVTPLYKDYPDSISHATRFSGYWIIYRDDWLRGDESNLVPNKRQRFYLEKINQDFNKYKPALIFADRNRQIAGEAFFNWIMDVNSGVKNYISEKYTLIDPLKMERSHFQTMRFADKFKYLELDIYIRNDLYQEHEQWLLNFQE